MGMVWEAYRKEVPSLGVPNEKFPTNGPFRRRRLASIFLGHLLAGAITMIHLHEILLGVTAEEDQPAKPLGVGIPKDPDMS